MVQKSNFYFFDLSINLINCKRCGAWPRCVCVCVVCVHGRVAVRISNAVISTAVVVPSSFDAFQQQQQ